MEKVKPHIKLANFNVMESFGLHDVRKNFWYCQRRGDVYSPFCITGRGHVPLAAYNDWVYKMKRYGLTLPIAENDANGQHLVSMPSAGRENA